MAHHDFWIDRLSDHLDGHLSVDESAAVDEHLAACPDCRVVADQLEEVKRRARALGGIAPERDLWTDIRSRLSATSDVVDLTLRLDPPVAPALRGSARARRFGGGLRAAAMVALMLGTGAAGWGLRAAFYAPDSEAGLESAAERMLGSGIFAAARGDEASGGSAEALARDVADLERLLEAGAGQLDIETIRVLRKNLAIIQTAVAESRAALEIDPDNDYVRTHLEGAVARQRAFVQRAQQLLSAD